MPVSTVEELRSATVILIVVNIHSVILTLVAIKLTRAVIKRQDALVNGQL